MTEQNATKAPEAVQGDWKAKASEAVQESWKVAQEKAGKAAVATNEAVQLWVVVPVNKGVAKAGEVWKAGLPPWMTEMWSKKLADMSAFAKTYTDRVTTTMNLWGDKLKLELLKYTSETTLRYLGVGLLGCGTLYLSSKMVFGGKGKRRTVKSSSRGLQLGAANGEGNGQPSLRRSMVPSEAIQSRTPAMKVALKQLGLAPGDSVLVVLHSIEAAEVETWCSACGAKAVYVDSSVVPSTDFIKDYVLSLKPKLVFYDTSLIPDFVKIEEGVSRGSADTASKITWIFAASTVPQKAWELDQTPKHIKHVCYFDWCQESSEKFDRMPSSKRTEELVFFENTPKQDENMIEALVNNVNQNVQSLSKLFTPAPGKPAASPERPRT